MKTTLKNIAKNLKKSSKVHAKQSKQIENIMKKSPANLKMKVRRIDQKSVYSPVGMKNAVRKSKSKSLSVKNKASELKIKKSPALAKLSASCKAAAKRKFKVYPSAYANMWAAKTQRQGKC